MNNIGWGRKVDIFFGKYLDMFHVNSTEMDMLVRTDSNCIPLDIEPLGPRLVRRALSSISEDMLEHKC